MARFRAQWKKGKGEFLGEITKIETQAAREAQEEADAGAKFAVVLRDSQGEDHPDNAGKFFLHRIIKS